MPLTTTMKHLSLSRLPAWIAAFAIVMAAGAAPAEDKNDKAKAAQKDLYKQIEAAVLSGELTKEEAQAKLKALKQQGDAKTSEAKQSVDKETVAHLETIWAELQALVAAGKMSEDQANAAMGMIKESVGGAKHTTKSATKKLPAAPAAEDVYKQIEAAVIAGKITKEEAQAKLKALQQQDATKQPEKNVDKKDSSKTEKAKEDTEAYLKKVWTELEAAVAAGKLTKDEAIAKMSAIKKAKLAEE